MASHLSGGAGLTGFDSAALKGILLAHGQASQRLRVVFARFIGWLANGFPPWAAYRALLACRELALGKKPIGIRPIGIGDIFRRAAAKVVLLVAGPAATTACGADQLCAGLKVGVESGVHAVAGLWAEMDEEERQGFLVIDAENAFNSLSRVNMLWNVRHLWPEGARFAFNLYCFTSLLICRSNTGEHLQMWSKEGSIQGCPLSMFLYGIGVLPLIQKLKVLHPDIIQS